MGREGREGWRGGRIRGTVTVQTLPLPLGELMIRGTHAVVNELCRSFSWEEDLLAAVVVVVVLVAVLVRVSEEDEEELRTIALFLGQV